MDERREISLIINKSPFREQLQKIEKIEDAEKNNSKALTEMVKSGGNIIT